MKIYSVLLVAFFSFLLLSNSCENTAEEIAKLEGGVKATVTTVHSADGCPFLMEIQDENGAKQLLMPINLEETYKKNGTVVLMKYTVSRIQQTDCLIGTPIVIDEIVLLQ